MNLPICAKQVFKYSQINKLASDNQGVKIGVDFVTSLNP